MAARVILFGIAGVGLAAICVYGCYQCYMQCCRKKQAAKTAFYDIDQPLPQRRSSLVERYEPVPLRNQYQEPKQEMNEPLLKENRNQGFNSFDLDNLRAELTCPITQQIFKDPVVTPFGHVFERLAIINYIRREHLCPLTRNRLEIGDLKNSGETKQKLEILKALSG